jgi:cysteine-rich repeat protein
MIASMYSYRTPGAFGLPVWLALALLGFSGCLVEFSSSGNNQNSQGICGDGNLDSGEDCDDGTANSDFIADACRTTCLDPWCGDGVTDAGEECDDGNGANPDGCLTACTGTDDCCIANVCGDGYQNQQTMGGDLVEMCDDGNTVDDADCSADCGQDMTLCGNGSIDQGEDCDDGAANSDTAPDACRLNCHPPVLIPNCVGATAQGNFQPTSPGALDIIHRNQRSPSIWCAPDKNVHADFCAECEV